MEVVEDKLRTCILEMEAGETKGFFFVLSIGVSMSSLNFT